MKIGKKIIIIIFITVASLFFSNLKSSCSFSGAITSPLAFFTDLFHNGRSTQGSGISGNSEISFTLDGIAFAAEKKAKIKVTFIELGSVNCIPCKMMKPVMQKVEQKYGDQVSVVFYDVWTKQGEPYGREYGIRAIPTQVFLDANGKEYFRHVGYFPFEELEKVLRVKGVR